MVLLQHIRNWLDTGETGNITQKRIGIKQIFRGYIVKDWFSDNETETKYTKSNCIVAVRTLAVGAITKTETAASMRN